MTMVKMGGASENAQIGVSVVLRPKDGENKYYAVHDDVAEVYYVIEGKGTMKLGGTITDWERRPVSIENGEGSRGTTSVGAKDVTISKGDMLIIPAGTPHKWEKSDEFTYYVVVRADLTDDKSVIIEAMNPQMLVDVTGEPQLEQLAEEITDKLQAAIDSLNTLSSPTPAS